MPPTLWRPTPLGRLFTAAPKWSIGLTGEHFTLGVGDSTASGEVDALQSLDVVPGLFWSTLHLTGTNGQTVTLGGLPNARAKQLRKVLADAIAAKRHRLEIEQLIGSFSTSIEPVVHWARNTVEACKRQLGRRGWLGHAFTLGTEASKPRGLEKLLDVPEVQRHLATQPAEIQDAVRLWRRPLSDYIDAMNRQHVTQMLAADSTFFDRVEKSPLTVEQRDAVVCFDDRVLLVASAGSGKTSTMVAKAGYALKHGYFAADKMLLLAFNNDAAAELRERIRGRLGPLGLPADKIVAKTFHAFGLDVIGKATGKRPTLAPWVESGRDLDALLNLIDELKDRDPSFRLQWDLFRLVFGQDLPTFGQEQESPDSWDSERRRGAFWTLNNEKVKSRGELLIANWLFYNGVRYVYEGRYEHDTATSEYRQYYPDFYLPDAQAYLEHWALDEKGNPPPEFMGYRDGMAWKRQTHATHGTRLLETTMAGLWSGQAFRYLSTELPKLGITLDPNPERPVPGRKPIENRRLAGTFRSFLTHAKSNRLSVADLRARLSSGAAGTFRFRHEMFLRLFEPLWAAWEAKLRADRCIDFDDMLNLAADGVEGGGYTSPYELVMVDEFQDASQARARLVASLLRGPDKYLFAVGDDWQSINRFAGADLSVMTDFERKFGKSVTLRLETTFRCPPSLCDISGRFVRKNPRQIAKTVRSPKPDVPNAVRIVRAPSDNHVQSAVEERVREIAQEAAAAGKRAKVYVLGRYQKDRAVLPRLYDAQWVELDFITVHAAKGLEADHVIVPGMTSEVMGFPSRIESDPVLQLAMPGADAFEFSEERRLFYVALTRAKQTATLVTVAHKESSFIGELVKDHQLQVSGIDGDESSAELCPLCSKAFVVPKHGRYGLFYSCSAFPRCTYKRSSGQRRTQQ